MRVLAVDDERPALEDLARLLRPLVDEVTIADGGPEALRLLADGGHYDAVFLDVRMPGIDGLELAALLGRFSDPPALVFVSAHEGGAVDALELGLRPLDYLMKPVSRKRVEQALERVRAGGGAAAAPAAAQAAQTRGSDIITVEHQRGGATRLLERSSVLFLKAEGDYVRIHTDTGGRYLVRSALSEIAQRWEAHGFVRVHRSYLVNMRRAREVRPELGGGATVVMADGSEVPVARRHVADLRRRLRGDG